jgi:hypothetical protein
MADEIDDGGSLNQPGDQTPKNEVNLDGIPDEDDGLDGKLKEAPDKSEIVQKRKWREKYLRGQETIRRLEDEVRAKKESNQPTVTEEKELAAQKYIRDQARQAYEEIQSETMAREEKTLEAFQDKLDAVLDEYPDFTEDQVLEACEEYDVEPAIAAKILKKQSETKTKPKNPAARKASTGGQPEEKQKSKAKDMYGLAAEIKKQFFPGKE